MFSRKGSIQPNLYETDPLAVFDLMIHDFLDGFTSGPHGDDHPVGFRITDIIEQLIIPSRPPAARSRSVHADTATKFRSSDL